jgi:hypothetical protein
MAYILFLYGESEKVGPDTICRPSRFQVGSFFADNASLVSWIHEEQN